MNLSFRLFPKSIYVPVPPERRKSHLSRNRTLWQLIFIFGMEYLQVLLLGRKNGFEGGVGYLAGGYRAELLFSEDVALQQLLGNTDRKTLAVREPA